MRNNYGIDLVHPDIRRAELFGSRSSGGSLMGRCSKCCERVREQDEDACFDGDENLFCSEECFKNFFGFRTAADS